MGFKLLHRADCPIDDRRRCCAMQMFQRMFREGSAPCILTNGGSVEVLRRAV